MRRLMEAYNNLGAAFYRMSERTHSQHYYTRALVNFTRAAEIHDLLGRDFEDVVRTPGVSLAHLNMRFALLNAGRPIGRGTSPVLPYSAESLQMESTLIYAEIDKDMFGRFRLFLE
jgi:hypothetical protein